MFGAPKGSSRQDYVFAANERPAFPGSPYAPRHTASRRAAYLAISILCGVTSNLVNSMITVNLPNLAGAMGAYLAEVAWLPAVYVAFNATANLTLIKARAQLGINQISHGLLLAYLVAVVVQIAMPSFAATLVLRALCGMSMAALLTLSLYNMVQVFPAQKRPAAFLVGISVPQLGIPLARLIPVEMLALRGWLGLHLVELVLILAVLASTTALPIPQSDRERVFETLDAVTIALLLSASILVCGVLSVGRYVWWTDAPWVGWSLALALPLGAAAFALEHLRARPLIHTRWIGTGEMLRFTMVAVLVRVALAEQAYGSVGLLSAGGLINDQMHVLFALVAIAMVAGIVVALLVTRPDRILPIVCIAALIIAAGAWLDTAVSNVTRAPQLIGSQMLIGFGTTLFIGPSMLLGFSRVLQRGTDHVVTFIVLFGATQNIGGLAGSALLGSLQQIRTREHMIVLAQRLPSDDPLVAERMRSYAAGLSTTIADPVLLARQGVAQLGQSVAREASVLAFIDVFGVVMWLALGTAAFVAIIIAAYRWRIRAGRVG